MIDQSGPASDIRLPVPVGPARALVLAAVFVCAACGLVYELELVALAAYLAGDSVTQTSVILSVMVFAMGVGSLLAKHLRCAAAVGFAAVEAALALVGGLSVMALYASFAWLGQTQPAMIAVAFVIGVLIGAEIPLLMTLIQRVRRQDASGAVSDLFAADYIGALAGGLAFPFLLLPFLGQLTGALAVGAVNAVAGGAMVLWLFRGDLTRRARGWLLTANVAVIAALATAAAFASCFEQAAQQALYGDDVRLAKQTEVQRLVLTGSPGAPLELFLDGRLQVRGSDEFRYHEALVHPAMAGARDRVLILGGADGLAAREALRYPDVGSVTIVDVDAELTRLARTDPGMTALNHRSLHDARVTAESADAFHWLRGSAAAGAYDIVIADLPDPANAASAKLYSQQFYGLAARALAPGGRITVHAASSWSDYWTAEATIRGAGLRTAPYRFPGRETQRRPDSGFVLASHSAPALRLAGDSPQLRSLTTGALRAAVASRPPGFRPSTLLHPRYSG